MFCRIYLNASPFVKHQGLKTGLGIASILDSFKLCQFTLPSEILQTEERAGRGTCLSLELSKDTVWWWRRGEHLSFSTAPYLLNHIMSLICIAICWLHPSSWSYPVWNAVNDKHLTVTNYFFRDLDLPRPETICLCKCSSNTGFTISTLSKS